MEKSLLTPGTKAGKKAMRFFNPAIQGKLTVNNPNDKYEQEADTMADKVMRMEQPFIQAKPLIVIPVQRKCAHCEEEEKKVQLKKDINAEESTADNNLENYVGSLSGGGQSLPNDIRNFYEPRFGYDFSSVKVHTDNVAAKSAQSINALAYTNGNNIVFNSGQYAPNTDNGKRLLGHELTHVVQQGNAANFLLDKPHTSIQKSSGSVPQIMRLSFTTNSSSPNKKDIKETLRDEGNSFSFGFVSDPTIFSWQNDVIIHGTEQDQLNNWIVGMLQVMKDYRLHIWWGTKPNQKYCGGAFTNVNLRDVKNSMSGSPWFDDLTTSEPFAINEDKKTTMLNDSPGALKIPYHNPEAGSTETFGNFDFGCSFVTYLSAFNYNNPQSPEAWRHLKSVNWETHLNGSFDTRQPAETKLNLGSGDTVIGDVRNGYSSSTPPKLSGLAALDKICPINQCWVPSLKCAKVIIP